MADQTRLRLDLRQPGTPAQRKVAPPSLRDLVASVPLFAGLSPAQHEALALIGRRRPCRRGEEIFAEGEKSEGFYVVFSGRVKIYKLSPEGKEQILHLFGPGESFGEVSVFSGRDFPAHARAVASGSVLFFPREAFTGLIRRDPDLAMNMLATLAARLRSFTVLIEDLSLKEVPGRLASYLLYFRRRTGGADEVALDISKGELAALLGTIPETLSRVLARMARQRLISVAGARIRLLDRNGLEDLAGGVRRLP